MSFIESALVGKRISHVLVDSEITYIMLANGTQITIRGLMMVEPHPDSIPVIERRETRTGRPA